MQNHKEIRGHVFRLKLFHNARCATFIIPIKGVGRFPSYLPENKSSYDLKTTLILGLQSIPVPQHISIWVQLELHHRSPAKQLVQPFQEYLFATWPVHNISIQDTSVSPTPKAQLFTNASTDCISSLNEASPNAGCECAVSPCKPQKWWNTIAPPMPVVHSPVQNLFSVRNVEFVHFVPQYIFCHNFECLSQDIPTSFNQSKPLLDLYWQRIFRLKWNWKLSTAHNSIPSHSSQSLEHFWQVFPWSNLS